MPGPTSKPPAAEPAAPSYTQGEVDVTDAMIESDATTPADVLSWGIGTRGQRYSPLNQVNTTNVSELVPVWAYSFGGEK